MHPKFEKLLKSVGLAHQKLLYTHHARMCLDEIVGNLNKKNPGLHWLLQGLANK